MGRKRRHAERRGIAKERGFFSMIVHSFGV